MTNGVNNCEDGRAHSDIAFLRAWEQTSARDTAAMLRASMLRRTNPDLVHKIAQEARTSEHVSRLAGAIR